MADAAELRRRLDKVERTILEVGWSPRIANALAAEFGVEKRTVYRYRAQVMEDMKEAVLSDERDALRAEFSIRIRDFQRKAIKAGAWGAASSMLNCEQKLHGFEKAPQEQPKPPSAAETVGVIADALAADAGLRAELAAALGERGWVMALDEQ